MNLTNGHFEVSLPLKEIEQINTKGSNKTIYLMFIGLGVIFFLLVGTLIDHHFKMNPEDLQTITIVFGDKPQILQGGCLDHPDVKFNNGFCVKQRAFCDDGFYLASTTAGSHAIQCLQAPKWTPELIKICDSGVGCQGLTQEIRDSVLQSQESVTREPEK